MEFIKQKRAQLFKKADEEYVGELVLRCGEVVTRSGIYEALHHHDDDADSGNTLIALRGEVVSPCQRCGQRVSLRLIYAAPHISEDADFSSDPELRT